MKVSPSKWIVLGCAALAIPACSGLWWPELVVMEGFERGLEDWTAGADVPEDPDNPGQPVAWSITQSDAQACSGDYSAEFYLDGRQDEGTIWLARSFRVEQAGRYRVTVLLDLWSESESFNTIAKVAFYAGPAEPAAETDFDTTRAANQSAGWRIYTFTGDVTAGEDRTVWVAFGISAAWETEMTYYIDNVLVMLRPAGS